VGSLSSWLNSASRRKWWESSTEPGQDRVGQQRQQNIGADVSPDHGSEHRIGILAKVEDARGIGIAAVCLELQAQLAEAEDGEVKAGKQCGLRHAADNAKPSPESDDRGHGCLLKPFDSRDVFHAGAGNAALGITAYWLVIAEMGSSACSARCDRIGGDAAGVISRPC
jgi:hypothetical protein